MTERVQRSQGSSWRTARRRTPLSRGSGPRSRRTAVPVAPPGGDTGTGPTILGFPAEPEPEEDDGEERVALDPAPRSGVALVVHRRPDLRGGAALVLAGLAANLSLFLPWTAGEGPNGLFRVEQGVDVLGSGIGTLARSDVWQPLAVVSCGGLLVLLGLLLFVPARAHRLVGVVALLVTLVAAASVVALLADAGWNTGRLGPGLWCAAAVPVLGLVGALLAMLTGPLVTAAAPDDDVEAPEL